MNHPDDKKKDLKPNGSQETDTPLEPETPESKSLADNDGGPNPPQPPPGKGGH